MPYLTTSAEKQKHRELIEQKIKEYGIKNIKIIKGAGMKKCTQCGQEKKLWDFAMTETGRKDVCKDCDGPVDKTERLHKPRTSKKFSKHSVESNKKNKREASSGDHQIHLQLNTRGDGGPPTVTLGISDFFKIIEAMSAVVVV